LEWGRSGGLHQGHPGAFPGFERLLEKYPVYQEKFTFVQIGAQAARILSAITTSLPTYKQNPKELTGAFRGQVGSRFSPKTGSIATSKLNVTTGRQTFVWSRPCMTE